MSLPVRVPLWLLCDPLEHRPLRGVSHGLQSRHVLRRLLLGVYMLVMLAVGAMSIPVMVALAGMIAWKK